MANVLVNLKKIKRAEEIKELLGRTARNDSEKELKEKYGRMVKEEKVSDKDMLEYIYTTLGGLVRTEAEEKKAKEKAKEQKKRYNKKTDKEKKRIDA